MNETNGNGKSKEQMVEKLRKLLALAASPVEAEAKLAMQKASEIMAKYSLDLSMLDSEKKPKRGDLATIVVKPYDGSPAGYWEAYLAAAVGKAFDCQTLLHGWGRRDESNGQFSFIGFKKDLEMAEYYHSFLRRSIYMKSRKEYDREKDRTAYALGFVQVIGVRLAEMLRQRNEAASNECRDLIVVKADAVREYMKELYPKLGTGKQVQIGNRSAWDRGREDGKNARLNTGIGGSAPSSNNKKLH